jgi:glycosyltransferase involved in cell wall biosynthesis
MFVTASLAYGGAEHHAIALMNRLAERGHECHAAYVKRKADQLERLRLGRAGTVRCLDARRYLDPRALSDFASHLSRVRPSVVVAANGYPLMYSALAMVRAGLRVPLVCIYHSTGLPDTREQLKSVLYRPFLWTADCTVFVCENQRRYCMRRGLFSRRNEVIHNGVDTQRFRDTWSAEERNALRAGFGFSGADYVIGIAAALRPEKNHLQLVEAVARLRDMGIPAKALLVGEGEMHGAIEARACALGIPEHVAITGFLQDVRPCLAASDVVALCSVTEAFSLAAIEAMAMGKPVVHSEVGGAAEMIFPGHNGFLFPAGNTTAFVHRLVILSDRPTSISAGRSARSTVESLLSESRMVDRYEEMLLELCETGAGVTANS